MLEQFVYTRVVSIVMQAQRSFGGSLLTCTGPDTDNENTWIAREIKLHSRQLHKRGFCTSGHVARHAIHSVLGALCALTRERFVSPHAGGGRHQSSKIRIGSPMKDHGPIGYGSCVLCWLLVRVISEPCALTVGRLTSLMTTNRKSCAHRRSVGTLRACVDANTISETKLNVAPARAQVLSLRHSCVCVFMCVSVCASNMCVRACVRYKH